MIYLTLLSNPKLFTDDTSIFSVVEDHLNFLNILNKDLPKFLSGHTSGKFKNNINNHPVVSCNNHPINEKPIQKHPGLLLDEN